MHRKRIVVAGIVLLLCAMLVSGFLSHLMGGTTKTLQAHPTPAKSSPASSISPTIQVTRNPTSAVGSTLSIPSIGVKAPLEDVGIVSSGPEKGSLDIPKKHEWTDVGWYDLGPYPGVRGSAVIDGHLNRPGGCCIPAVFWLLKKMHIGDVVTITNAKGQAWHFRTIGIKTLYNNASTDAIFNRTDGTYLNLITCAGNWIPAQHQTTERLVVYTTLV